MDKPKKACPICRKMGCTEHLIDKWAHLRRRKPSTRKPPTYAQRKRRKQTVDRYIAQYGNVCPRCGGTEHALWAEHLKPVALGGSEDGPLTVLCAQCQRKQGYNVAKQANAIRRKARKKGSRG